MSRAPLRTSETAAPPLRPVGAPPPAPAEPVPDEPAEPRCFTEIIAARDEFAAEVSRELASIRALLSSLADGDHHEMPLHEVSRHESATNNLLSEPRSETGPVGPSGQQEEQLIAPPFRSEAPQRPLDVSEFRAASEAATSAPMSEVDRSGPDRLAALKERIAAKLRAETGTTLPSPGSDETNRPPSRPSKNSLPCATAVPAVRETNAFPDVGTADTAVAHISQQAVRAEETEKANGPGETSTHPTTEEGRPS